MLVIVVGIVRGGCEDGFGRLCDWGVCEGVVGGVRVCSECSVFCSFECCCENVSCWGFGYCSWRRLLFVFCWWDCCLYV